MKIASSSIPSALVALIVSVALAVSIGSTAAQTFTGNPILLYDEPFAIWSAGQNSYCTKTSNSQVTCLGVTDITQATRFAVGGGCGGVPYTGDYTVSLYMWNQPQGNTWCYLYPTLTQDPNQDLWCNAAMGSDSLQFQLRGWNVASDGYIHVNATQTIIRAKYGNWCSAQPATNNGGIMQCQRASASGWEAFSFVPLW